VWEKTMLDTRMAGMIWLVPVCRRRKVPPRRRISRRSFQLCSKLFDQAVRFKICDSCRCDICLTASLWNPLRAKIPIFGPLEAEISIYKPRSSSLGGHRSNVLHDPPSIHFLFLARGLIHSGNRGFLASARKKKWTSARAKHNHMFAGFLLAAILEIHNDHSLAPRFRPSNWRKTRLSQNFL
jgi:hypothetical protein